MSDQKSNLPAIAERKINIFFSQDQRKKPIVTSVRTWGELKEMLGKREWGSEDFRNKTVRIRENRHTLDVDSAVLPDESFTLFVFPEQQKGGAYQKDEVMEYGYSAIRSLGSEINKKFPEAEIDLQGKAEDIRPRVNSWMKTNKLSVADVNSAEVPDKKKSMKKAATKVKSTVSRVAEATEATMKEEFDTKQLKKSAETAIVEAVHTLTRVVADLLVVANEIKEALLPAISQQTAINDAMMNDPEMQALLKAKEEAEEKEKNERLAAINEGLRQDAERKEQEERERLAKEEEEREEQRRKEEEERKEQERKEEEQRQKDEADRIAREQEQKELEELNAEAQEIAREAKKNR